MTAPTAKDSFGEEIKIGTCVTFVTKTRYIHSQSIGKVIKISPKGQVTIRAINTGGRSLQGYAEYKRDHRANLRAGWEKRGVTEHLNPDHWLHTSKDDEEALPTITDTRVHDGSSCVVIRHVHPEIQMYLDQA